MRFEILTSAALSATGVLAQNEVRATKAKATTTEPCGLIASAASSYYEKYPKATSVKFSNVTTVWDCLKSVPLDEQRDVELVDYMVPYIQFQSTLALLKEPPEDYLMPSVDVLGGIAIIREKLGNKSYTNQLDFIQDLESIYVMAHDGHFWYEPALTSIFGFESGMELVSVSEDGVSTPLVYAWSDIYQASVGVTSNYSDIVSIDGVPVVEALEKIATYVNSQDPDSAYNSVFRSLGSAFAGRDNLFWEANGTSHTYQFSNGSTAKSSPVAILPGTFEIDGRLIVDGSDVHAAYEVPSTATAGSGSGSRKKKRAGHSGPHLEARADAITTTFTGYPDPIVQNTGGWASGYYLSNDEDSTVAVLSLWSFEGSDDQSQEDAAIEFRDTLQAFWKACKDAGKTKLIVDLQYNGGGSLVNGFELFKELFPTIPITYPLTDRAISEIDLAGQVLGLEQAENNILLDADGNKLEKWSSLFGPQVVQGDNFTNFYQFDFTSEDFPYVIYGYPGANSSISASPFSADDIVIITDGTCASTCTSFTGLATRLGGAKSIAFGGRPVEQPMQAMGGVKGGTEYPWQILNELGNQVYQYYENLNEDIPEDYRSFALNTSDPPLLPPVNGSDYSVNFRNAHYNFTDPIPLQFIYEAAHCKSFFTMEMITSVEAVWERAADIAWNKAKCVAGSTFNTDDTIGDNTVAFSKEFKADWNYYIDGPGAVNPNTTFTTTVGTGTSSSSSPSSSSSSGASSTTKGVSLMGGMFAVAAIAFGA